MAKLKNILYKENSGDFSGAGTFQGGPFGFGNRYQLASSMIWPGLLDPNEDLPNEPSMWPALRAQKDSDKTEYDSLESADVYDDRPHLLPGEDTVRDELLDKDNDIEPSYFYEEDLEDVIFERQASDILYRDLYGWPPMNTLSNPIDHIPYDQDRDEDSPEERERYITPKILPSPRERERGKPFGYGRYVDKSNLNLSKNTSDTNLDDPMNGMIYGPENSTMYDPMNDEITDNDLKLSKEKELGQNNWKVTTKQNMGHTNRDASYSHLTNQADWMTKLASHRDFIKMERGQNEYKDKLDSDDDVITHAGSMGVISNPVNRIPNYDPHIYKKGNPGYSLGESKEFKMPTSKESKTKRKITQYLPKDLDTKIVEKPYGKNFGTTYKKYEFSPEDHEIKEEKPVETDVEYIPYVNGTSDHFSIILQTKLFDKLAKLAKKDK